MGIFRATFRTPTAKGALVVLALIAVVAAFANFVAPQSPYVQNISTLLAKPSWHHLLGTDYLGRDNLSRIIIGSRSSLLGALEAVGIGFAVGVPFGIASVFLGKGPQFLVMRVVDALMTIPAVVFAIGAVAVLGEKQTVAMGAIGLLFAPHIFRVVRASTLNYANLQFVEVAELFGASRLRIVASHVWHKVLPTLAVVFASQFAAGILAVSSLAYLGIGSQPPLPTWGSMLSDDMNYLAAAGWEPIFPGLAIVLVVGSLSLIADALRDVTRNGGLAVEVEVSRPRRWLSVNRQHSKLPSIALPDVEEGVSAPTGARVDPARAERWGERQRRSPVRAAAPLLEVEELAVTVPAERARVEVVHEVSFQVARGESVGLVGESGSGKTLTCRSVLGVLPTGVAVSHGSIRLDGVELTTQSRKGWQQIHGSKVGAIFQDPASYLNPSVPVGRQLAEVLRVKKKMNKREAHARSLELMEAVGLKHPEFVFHQIPSELSGGMLQRVMIAIAVATEPQLVVADEATTALDVVTQGAVIDLLRELQQRLGLALLFVSHDLAVVSELCDRIIVFYAGEIVEVASHDDLISRPLHPYAEALLRVGAPRRQADQLETIPGQPPAIGEDVTGCRFAPRCAYAIDACRSAAAIELRTLDNGRVVRCCRAEELTLLGSADIASSKGLVNV